MEILRKSLLGFAILTSAGCTGFSIPHIAQMQPYTYVRGGEQFGRDQLANRWLVGTKALPIKGKDQNEIISLLGQPQQVDSKERGISEDWYFIYYKKYKTAPETAEGAFMVRFYNSKVLDVVTLH